MIGFLCFAAGVTMIAFEQYTLATILLVAGIALGIHGLTKR